MEEDEELNKIKEKILKELLSKQYQKPKSLNKPLKLTIENFKDVISSNKLVIVDFWAEWCGPCKFMEPIIDELARKYENVVFGKVNVDEEPVLTQNFNIMSIPTFIIFKNGKPQEVIVGARSKRDLEAIISKYVNER
ncbi:MAG: thioredoxin [Thermoproteota archaeon]|jgi:thioredoxin